MCPQCLWRSVCHHTGSHVWAINAQAVLSGMHTQCDTTHHTSCQEADETDAWHATCCCNNRQLDGAQPTTGSYRDLVGGASTDHTMLVSHTQPPPHFAGQLTQPPCRSVPGQHLAPFPGGMHPVRPTNSLHQVATVPLGTLADTQPVYLFSSENIYAAEWRGGVIDEQHLLQQTLQLQPACLALVGG